MNSAMNITNGTTVVRHDIWVRAMHQGRGFEANVCGHESSLRVVRLGREIRIDEIPVLNETESPVGLLDVHNLVTPKVIEKS
jgi:hypothetical protein